MACRLLLLCVLSGCRSTITRRLRRLPLQTVRWLPFLFGSYSANRRFQSLLSRNCTSESCWPVLDLKEKLLTFLITHYSRNYFYFDIISIPIHALKLYIFTFKVLFNPWLTRNFIFKLLNVCMLGLSFITIPNVFSLWYRTVVFRVLAVIYIDWGLFYGLSCDQLL